MIIKAFFNWFFCASDKLEFNHFHIETEMKNFDISFRNHSEIIFN